jgi:hypothetical protein
VSAAEWEGSVTLGTAKRTDYERSVANFVRLIRIFNTDSDKFYRFNTGTVDEWVLSLNLLWYHRVYVTPVLFDSRFF